jgi:serine/threonine protein kinase
MAVTIESDRHSCKFLVALRTEVCANPVVTPQDDPGEAGTAAPVRHKRPLIPDFELIRPIGQGSYGDVWLARGLTGVYRAIKVVWRDRFPDAEPFEREFKGLKKFTSMSLPESSQLALLHVGQNEAGGYFYYVMELADDAATGRDVDPARYIALTLREVRARRNRLPAEECVSIGVELARALAGLHSRGLVHRDIKPSNVIMVGGVPKLADIGLVASTDDARTFVGTEGYVPPEGPGKPSADVFALGKLLYELATGLDREDYPRLPDDLLKPPDHGVLLELNEVILQSCDPDGARRYRDGDAMLGDLLELQAGHSIRSRRSHARTAWLAGVLMIILAAAATANWWRTHSAQAAVAPASEGRQLVARAWKQMNKNEVGPEDLDVAEGLCRRATELEPTDADAWAAWSQVNSWYVGLKIDQSAGRREAARSQAARALKLAPDSYEARLAHACYLLRVAPYPHWSESFPTFAPEADGLLRQLLREQPDEPRALRAFGSLQMGLGHMDEARVALTRLTRNPQFAAWAWRALSEAEMRSGSGQ